MHLVGARGPEKAEARSPQSQNGVAAEMTRSRVRATHRDREIDIQEWNANYSREVELLNYRRVVIAEMHGRDGKDAARDVVGQDLCNQPSAPDLCYAGVAHYGRVATQLPPLLMIKTQQRSHFSQQRKPEISFKLPPSGRKIAVFASRLSKKARGGNHEFEPLIAFTCVQTVWSTNRWRRGRDVRRDVESRD